MLFFFFFFFFYIFSLKVPTRPSSLHKSSKCFTCMYSVEYHQSVKQFGSRSGPMFRQAWSVSKLFAKLLPLVGKGLTSLLASFFSDIKTIKVGVSVCLLIHVWPHPTFLKPYVCLCWGLTTRQPLWVIFCRLPEKGRRDRRDIEEIVKEMKERDRGGRKKNERRKTRNKNIPPLPLPAAKIAGLAQL